jgi:uncharacterized protein (TIRG00374 family)
MLKINMIKTLLKSILGIALVVWLIQSGKLNFSLITASLQNGPEMIYGLALIILQGAMAAFRFLLIVNTKSKEKNSYFKILKLNWIGMFFSTIIPGAVSGDLIKFYYLKKENPSMTKTILFTSLFLDRILGLLGLLFISTIISTLFYSDIVAHSPKLIHALRFNYFLFAGGIAIFIIIFSSKKLQKIIMHFIFKIPTIGKKITPKLEQVFSFNGHKKTLYLCLFISVLNQFLNILGFWIIARPFFTVDIPLQYLFSFIPIGLIAVAIPISPAGLGVGHAIFQNLFTFVNISNGADLFNLYFITNVSVNLLGVIPYILAKKEKEIS